MFQLERYIENIGDEKLSVEHTPQGSLKYMHTHIMFIETWQSQSKYKRKP